MPSLTETVVPGKRIASPLAFGDIEAEFTAGDDVPVAADSGSG